MNSALFASCCQKYGKNAIYLTPAGESASGNTHLGGLPLLPPDFVYPTFTGEGADGYRERPMSLLAQIDCAELHALDSDALLPDHGILSFFYEQDSQCWGRDAEDTGCARVCWFADEDALRETPLPDDLDPDYVIPRIPVCLNAVRELPDTDEIGETDLPELETLIREDKAAFQDYLEARSPYHGDTRIKLLGYADTIQSDMHTDCVRATHPLFISKQWADVTDEDRAVLRAESEEWILLFQMDSLDYGDFRLRFGDSGMLYFWIRKSDLAKRDFSKTWTILQCY